MRSGITAPQNPRLAGSPGIGFPGGPNVVQAASVFDLLYLHDICNTYFTIGNTDGNINQTTPSATQTTVVDFYTYKFTWREPLLPIMGFGLYNNGGAAPAVTASGVWTVLGSLYRVLPDENILSGTKGSGKPGMQVTQQVAVCTLTAEQNRSWFGFFNEPVFLPAGDYAWGIRYNPSFNAGEMGRGNFVYYKYSTTNQMKIASQGAFNSGFPSYIGAATFVAWNGGGAGSQLVGLGDLLTVVGRCK